MRPDPKHLSADEIDALSSDYIARGEREEAWQLRSVEIGDGNLTATVAMTTIYKSGTDEQGFHLSVFTAAKLVSQLIVIYMHDAAGLAQKSREVWMAEFHSRHHHPVRDPDAINITMAIKSRTRGRKIFSRSHCQLEDDRGGLFEINMKTIMDDTGD